MHSANMGRGGKPLRCTQALNPKTDHGLLRVSISSLRDEQCIGPPSVKSCVQRPGCDVASLV